MGIVSLTISNDTSDIFTLAVDSPTRMMTGIVMPKIGTNFTEIEVVSLRTSFSPSGFSTGTALKYICERYSPGDI